MGEWNFSSEELPQTQGITEDIGLDGVARALREHLGGHPAQVLHRPKGTRTQKRPAELASEPTLETGLPCSQTAWAGNYCSLDVHQCNGHSTSSCAHLHVYSFLKKSNMVEIS